MSRVLVTGASGYIALHVIDLLLKQGHHVRGTVRNLNDSKKVDPIKKLGVNYKNPLELVEADLLNAESWDNAVDGIDIVMHIASPLPPPDKMPTDENELIKPAVEGTLNVFRASLNKNVKRVVLTSSGLAVYDWQNRNYSEKDWPDLDKVKLPYPKSKILAERAAWEFVEQRKNNQEPCFELAVIHPVLVMGPILTSVTGSSASRFMNVFTNKTGKIPNQHFFTCDVRDVALAHVKAAFLDEAVGHRHLIVSSRNFIPIKRWAEILKEEFEPKGFKISTEIEGDDPSYKDAQIDDTRMRTVLGITPTDFKSTIVDMAYSFIQNGLIKL